MTLYSLLQRYIVEGNERGVKIISRLMAGRSIRLLINDTDNAIYDAIGDCTEWQSIKQRGYVNKRGDFATITSPDVMMDDIKNGR